LALFKRLVDNGVHEKLAAKMFEKINAAAAGNPLDDERSMGELLKRAITCRGSIAPTPGYPKVVALVGPTGVGKTTTIAKLAAHYAINERKRVALASLDTYRIGAVEQLRVYGDIMRLPVEAASGQKDFRKVLSKHSDKDLILVDTTGKCHRDHAHAGQLAEVLKMSGPVETHLVLSVTLQEKILEQAHKQFAPLNVDGVLFTKLDEGMSFGSMLNFTLQTRLPFTYLTTGQRVPEDIEVAAHDRVIRLIFN
jgi:flagellar biosynthesis protein FlhF